MYRSVLPKALAIVDEALNVLNPRERAAIDDLLTRISRHLQTTWRPGPTHDRSQRAVPATRSR